MSYSQVLNRFLEGELNDAELSEQLEGWQEQLEALYAQVEGEDGELEPLERCDELLEQFVAALEEEDYDTLEELVAPMAAALQSCLAQPGQAVEKPYPGLPPEMRQLFVKLDELVAGRAQPADIKAPLQAVARATDGVTRAAATPGLEPHLLILREAAAKFKAGLAALEEAYPQRDPEGLAKGRGLLEAGYHKVLELKPES